MQREELNRYLDGLLEVSRYRDYCPNGLQVEGRDEIRRIVTGVTANLDLIQAAIAAEADAILVHHGYFWKGDDPCLTGTDVVPSFPELTSLHLLNYGKKLIGKKLDSVYGSNMKKTIAR